MKIVGLTGGIGMGKSTAAAAFRRARIPVFDADAAVHRLQSKGGRAIPVLDREFPGTIREGILDRAAMRQAVLGKPDALKRLERILHPMVRQEETRFLARARRAGNRVAVLDVPLLLETMEGRKIDKIVVVSAPRAIQIYRVGLRRRMSPADVAAVIARQMPDAEKRRKADVVVRTGLSRNHTLKALHWLIRELRG
jgi:dephospho-CoA kinase